MQRAIALLAVLAPSAAIQTIAATDPAFVTPVGRTFPVGSALGLSWLGGGFRVAHTGNVLRATCATTSPLGATGSFKLAIYESNEGNLPWQGVVWCPATGLNETVTIGVGSGAVVVTTNDAADYWAHGASAAIVLTLTTDGAFVPATPPPARVLHILGDSITAATNIRGGFPKCADEGYYSDYSSSWAGILCAYFGASCSTVAVGGKGLVKNCCDAGTTVPQFYTQLKKNDPDGSFAFKDAPPAGVIVYLGTNDYSKGSSPALDAAFADAWLALMTNVTTRYYPGADITFFAVLGPMSPTLPANATAAAVSRGTAAGFKIVFVNATTACGEDLAGCKDGCASHPGVASHRNIARMVAPAVEAALGWPVPGVL